MIKLNPNCSETVWKLTGVKAIGRQEYSIDSSSSPVMKYTLNEMVMLMGGKKNVSKVKVKVVESQGAYDEPELNVILNVAKKVKRGLITLEEGEKMVTEYEEKFYE